MIEGQEVMERTNLPTFCWRSTAVITDMYGGILHFFSVWYNLCNAFSSETLAYKNLIIVNKVISYVTYVENV
jgi:hypothetical protein